MLPHMVWTGRIMSWAAGLHLSGIADTCLWIPLSVQGRDLIWLGQGREE